MNVQPISKDIANLHQSQWEWQLRGHEVTTLAAEPQPRWLKVEAGSLWLTRRESGTNRGDDVWLCAGDSLALPADSAWVLEAWNPARVTLLQQAPSARRFSRFSRGGFSWPAWAAKLGWLRASLLPAS